MYEIITLFQWKNYLQNIICMVIPPQVKLLRSCCHFNTLYVDADNYMLEQIINLIMKINIYTHLSQNLNLIIIWNCLVYHWLKRMPTTTKHTHTHTKTLKCEICLLLKIKFKWAWHVTLLYIKKKQLPPISTLRTNEYLHALLIFSHIKKRKVINIFV